MNVAWLERGPIATAFDLGQRRCSRIPDSRRSHHQRRTEAAGTSRSSPRSLGGTEAGPGNTPPKGIAALPGQHRFGTGPISSRPQADERCPSRSIEGLGERDECLDSSGFRASAVGSASCTNTHNGLDSTVGNIHRRLALAGDLLGIRRPCEPGPHDRQRRDLLVGSRASGRSAAGGPRSEPTLTATRVRQLGPEAPGCPPARS